MTYGETGNTNSIILELLHLHPRRRRNGRGLTVLKQPLRTRFDTATPRNRHQTIICRVSRPEPGRYRWFRDPQSQSVCFPGVG